MNKKAISDIIATVLAILLVITTVGIMWGVIKNTTERVESVDIELLSMELEIQEDYVFINYTENILSLIIARGADNADLSEIRITVEGKDEGGDMTSKKYTIKSNEDDFPKQLESITVLLNITLFQKDSIQSISVFPVSKKGKLGLEEKHIVTPLDIRTPEDDWPAIERNLDSALEYCDGKDNNNDGRIDEACYCSGDSQRFCGKFSGMQSENADIICAENNCYYQILPCFGADINRDGISNEQDWLIFTSYFDPYTGETTEGCNRGNDWCERADLNLDGAVNIFDWGTFQQGYNKEGCNLPENITITCYSDVCNEFDSKSDCDNVPGCMFRWENGFCLKDTDCGFQEECIKSKCASLFEPRCQPFLNSIWTSEGGVLANGVWDREHWKAPGHTEVIGDNGDYVLRATGIPKNTIPPFYGYHAYDRSVVKYFSEGIQTWGGTIYVNLNNVDFTGGLQPSDIAFFGAYDSSTTTQRNFGIAAWKSFSLEESKNVYFYFKAYENNCYAEAKLSQTIQFPGIVYTPAEENYFEFGDEWIRIDWFFTPSYNLYARVNEGEWHNIGIFGENKVDFKRFDVGWVSSYAGGSIDIKDVSLYDENCVPQWVLEN